ncbi:hypothetical protein RS82_00288 [Microbacterium trichothecenolyticum]|uniref:Uncharacterized protein n=1 Tax=Microbacterium trichothecenolyticum TaxID=69370 RepID=A0A0M2HLJ6_MICTR|nr:hypothetical protein RS82_00288 [Microbacterium trichothecenolyticum]
MIQVSTRLYTSAEDLEQFRAAMWTSVAGQALLLAATPLAWLIVHGITQGVQRRGPVAAHLSVLANGEAGPPLTFGADLARALNGEPAPTGHEGKPLIQPWAVRPAVSSA